MPGVNKAVLGGIAFEDIPTTKWLMDTGAFFIEFLYKDKSELAEVKPCCQEESVFYYDVYIRNQYEFTVTPFADEEKGMALKVSLKNADNNIDPQLIESVGQQIEKHLL